MKTTMTFFALIFSITLSAQIGNEEIVERSREEFGDSVTLELLREMQSEGVLWLNELGFEEPFKEFIFSGYAEIVDSNRDAMIKVFFDEDRGEFSPNLQEITAFLSSMTEAEAKRHFQMKKPDKKLGLTSVEIGKRLGCYSGSVKTEAKIFQCLSSKNLFTQ